LEVFMVPPRTILLSADFSEDSRSAFQLALDLARRSQAQLTVLHVAPSPGFGALSYQEMMTELQPEGYHRKLERQMRQMLPAPVGARVEYKVCAGTEAQAIADAARADNCDLIILSKDERKGLGRWLLGDPAGQVRRLAPCPVVTARALREEGLTPPR
jgi:nucleotide-binding universal stress UspA family protein